MDRRTRTRLGWVALAGIVAALFGGLAGYFTREDLPDLARLEDYSPAQMTRVIASDGTSLASFATERRIVIGEPQIPETFRMALIASEDSRFADHPGIDLRGAVRAAVAILRDRRVSQGASTLTMQVAGNLYLDRSDRGLKRKLQEVFLALEIERMFSKQEILTIYTNQVHFGHGIYGLEAAARYYFDKRARDLTTGESAMLVGLLPRPAGYSPYRDPETAKKRRSLVLGRMVDEGFLSPAERERIEREPLGVVDDRRDTEAPYLEEGVRRWLQGRFGDRALYRGGLTVETTLDPDLQHAANRAVANGIDAYEKRRGKRPQAALVALDPRSGEVRALVGGSDFTKSEFDRATQAKRQPGSLFKPFVLAAALEEGRTLADRIVDEPTQFVDPVTGDVYEPQNFGLEHYGDITLRRMVEKSINVPAVKLLESIGAERVIETSRRLGIESRLLPYPSLALGAFELTLLEITSAYGAFANGGLLVEPHTVRSVRDATGQEVYRAEPDIRESLSPQIAYLMNRALAGVVNEGTARKASHLGPSSLAGKTGTTDDYTDAWFAGYTPDLVVGVWVGFDDPSPLGEGETGARAALPIWVEFMEAFLDGHERLVFERPDGIVTRWVGDRREWFLEGTEPAEAAAPTYSPVEVTGRR